MGQRFKASSRPKIYVLILCVHQWLHSWHQINNPFGLAKLNFTTMEYDSRVIPGPSSMFSYSHNVNQNLDFAADETGLWVIYDTADSKGHLVIAKIEEVSFDIQGTWQTSVYKPGMSNAFTVCGVLYAVRTHDIQTEEIFYKYDTKTKQESRSRFPLISSRRVFPTWITIPLTRSSTCTTTATMSVTICGSTTQLMPPWHPCLSPAKLSSGTYWNIAYYEWISHFFVLPKLNEASSILLYC